MRFITTRAHAAIDYIFGVFLIGFPYLFGTAWGGVMHWLPIILGITLIIYSLLTRYELGAMRVIPMSVHLILDIVSGALFAVSPWLFGFADQSYLPFLIVGLIEIGTSLMTRTDTAPLHEPVPAGAARQGPLTDNRR
jgi:hypothetical protein